MAEQPAAAAASAPNTPKMLDVASMDVATAVHTLIDHAARIGASDLFFLANEDYTSIQVRHLGIMRPISIVGADQGVRFVQHVKANAGMDVGEHRRPLDGRWIYESEDGTAVDLRINDIPTLYGEDLTMRLLSREQGLLALDDLGMIPPQLQAFRGMLTSPSGLILCTGPTGSGKTATLYAALRHLNNGQRKINTIEDPVEFSIDGMRQSQINTHIGVGFADLLRSVLRQSPDIVMIGEIRDAETARTAVRAANSGHLVFSTLHAPVAAAAIQSMRSLGVPDHFLATSLRGIIAQRLVRTFCPDCKQEFDISHAPDTFDEVSHLLDGQVTTKLAAAPGCAKCGQSGYAGRLGVFEVMDINRELRNLIAHGHPTEEVRRKAVANGMLEFRQAALLQVARGYTSVEEVFRVIPSEHLLLDDGVTTDDRKDEKKEEPAREAPAKSAPKSTPKASSKKKTKKKTTRSRSSASS
ncbi:MAG: GspE/PulE family protein [Phycisphaeraceae bacterium]